MKLTDSCDPIQSFDYVCTFYTKMITNFELLLIMPKSYGFLYNSPWLERKYSSGDNKEENAKCNLKGYTMIIPKKGDKRGNKKPLEEDNLFYCASVHANAVIFFFYANITL